VEVTSSSPPSPLLCGHVKKKKNKALLAKQGWLLIKSSESLAGKIIKAKYYPNSSFLEASLWSKPSFAWRSIYGTRELLAEGFMWRVGNGHRINI
jgi:hypothetical protein